MMSFPFRRHQNHPLEGSINASFEDKIVGNWCGKLEKVLEGLVT
jgi:hypothetical protein